MIQRLIITFQDTQVWLGPHFLSGPDLKHTVTLFYTSQPTTKPTGGFCLCLNPQQLKRAKVLRMSAFAASSALVVLKV